MYEIQESANLIKINGRWVPARPPNYKYRSLRERIRDSWSVFVGKADAVTYYGQ